MRYFNLTLINLLIFNASVFCQTPDAENCQDHAFFNRINNFYILECSKNYDNIVFDTGVDKSESIAGNTIKIVYSPKEDTETSLPSQMQVIKNFEDAMLKMKGKKIFNSINTDDVDFNGATFNFSKDQIDYWLKIELKNDPVNEYILTLVALEPMTQEITGVEIFETLEKGNPMILYLNFDNGLSSIKEESRPIIDKIYEMLIANAGLKIRIEGHTDNSGDPAANQKLSELRALNIKKVLESKGIQAERLEAKGYGQMMPVSENDTFQGKAKNRRVEIRKI